MLREQGSKLGMTIILALLALLFVIATAACNSSELLPTSPSPIPTKSMAASLTVKGDPQDIVLPLEALPAGFQKATGEYEGSNEYNVVYFRPEALTCKEGCGTNLMAIIVNLGIYQDAGAAREKGQAQGNLDRDSIMNSIREAYEEASPIDVQPYIVQLKDTDYVIAFHVEYTISSIVVTEYRYRIIINNALANVIVSARAARAGEDQSAFGELARTIVENQVARINRARS